MYNPFIKGELPVGVRTIELTGEDSNYTTEIWYPAADEYRGVEAIDTFKFVDEMPEASQEATREAKPSDKKFPLIVYWHGAYGHRREMAAMCVFLASHGFVVASADFPGDHITHMYGSNPLISQKPVDESAKARPRQAADVIELLVTSTDDFLLRLVDGSNIGSFGESMGGFTTLAVNSETSRVKASFPVCPVSGTRGIIPALTRLAGNLRTDNWRCSPSTFVVTGSADSFVFVEDVRDMFETLRGPKRLAILNGAGHLHWADNAELVHETLRLRYASGEFPDPELDGPKMAEMMRPFAELCPAQHAVDVMRSLSLAHFESVLKGSSGAREFLENGLAERFAERGIDLDVDTRTTEYGVAGGVNPG